jgi:hypothetical protein
MFGALGFASYVMSAFSTGLDLLKVHWKTALIIGGIIWALLCTKFHCGSGESHQATDTLSVKVDTFWVYPDTLAIFRLAGFDTVPVAVKKNVVPVWTAPVPSLAMAINCTDSLNGYVNALRLADALLTECDSTYRENTAFRIYGDTLRNDSIEISAAFHVRGVMASVPVFQYRLLFPTPVIRETITIEAPAYRKMYLEAGAGVWNTYTNDFRGFPAVSIGAGYMDRANKSYGLRGQISNNYWQAEFVFRYHWNL